MFLIKKAILASLVAFVFMSCYCTIPHSIMTKSFDPNKDLIALKEGGALKLIVPMELIISSAKKADKSWKEINSISLMVVDENTAYLVLKGIAESETPILKALLLIDSGEEQYRIAVNRTTDPISHSCAGNCCQECDFSILEGKIKGCKCVRSCPFPTVEGGGSYCTHSIANTIEKTLLPVSTNN